MSLALDDAFLPAILSGHPMTDEEFIAFCAEHPDFNFEMTAEAEIIAMSPTGFLTGASNSGVVGQLDRWSRRDGRGVCGDSSTGFVLPNGARRSPDASWTLKSRIESLDPRKRRGFLHLCPDFVIEIKSESDRLRTLRAKLREYIANGAQIGWLMDPEKRTVEVYRADGSLSTLTDILKIAGEGPVAGFGLDLTYVWDPLAD